MAGDTMRFRNPAGHAGLIHNLLALVNSLAGFLESRVGLFAKESKTALIQIVVLLACVIGAVILVVLGYFFFVASAIVAIAHKLHLSWIWISLAAAGVHFILALVCLLVARSRMKQSMFEVTTAELKKDREWLKNLDKRSLSSN
jgi:uncharacterized membrane protein YqjE